MAEIVNPYIAGAPVTESSMFFGREDVFRWIEDSLAGQYADHILVIHGQRRVGKTSVLKQLGKRLPGRYLPVFFDLQGRTHTTLDRFLWWLARETVRVLKQARDLDFPLPVQEAFASDAEYFEHRFLADLKPLLAGGTLLFTFDEFDNLEESEVKQQLARPLIEMLRRLMGSEGLCFIFSIGSSGRKLENMQATYTEFFKTALYKKISFLDQTETRNLITRPVEGVIAYDDEAVRRIYEIAAGHPYFTQLTCHELFARCQRTEQRQIKETDVASVLPDVIERGTVNLKFVWDEASDTEKWILAALAQQECIAGPALAAYLRKQRVRFSEPDLNSALLHLQEKDVITPENGFVIHLLKLWLQKNRPIEQAREELTEVNPIANRYIEIGLEFKDAGAFDKAIESFQEALAISSDNLQAQVSIGLTYMDQSQFDRAVGEFEKALLIDDEDVSARAGLCEAHLALGDAALKKSHIKEAIQSYQRVLAINGEHTEARQRMAEIDRQRAEKALQEGRDEDALAALGDALRYTPEEPSLIARVEEVRRQKKARVLATQMARAEKEAASRNWEKALAALQEALETAPGDSSILEKIAAFTERQLKDHLEAILVRVDQAEKSSRWDTAIASLNEYLSLEPNNDQIQRRLANLVEARHSAWLKAILARTEHAMGTQAWDQAIAALGEVLAVEPNNQEIQTKLSQVRGAERLAKLEALLRRADQAAQGERWEEAFSALNDGLAAEPENTRIQAKLAWVRAARRAGRVKAVLRLADTAAQAGKWDTGIAALKDTLEAEPGIHEVEDKLSELVAKQRESQLDLLRVRARDLSKAERFDAALKTWVEYLQLGPNDAAQAQAEMEALRKAQALAVSYGQAERAFAEKDYGRAIALLKEVIQQDTNYKDASRLLAESVELRRTVRKWWQSRWLLGSIIASGLVAGGWLVFRPGSPLLSAIRPSATQPAIASNPTTPAATTPNLPTSTAAPTPTALPFSWVRLNSGQFLARDAVSAIVADPSDPGVIYIGTDNAGIFKSIDGGITWQPMQNGLGRAWIQSLAIDPTDTQRLYAGTSTGGPYRTTDGGLHWVAIGTWFISGWEWIGEVVLDPANSRHLYYTQASEIYETLDGGDSWTEIYTRRNCPENISSLAFDPRESRILYATVSMSGACPAGVYVSTDAGRSWSFTGGSPDNLFRTETSDWWHVVTGKAGKNVNVYAYMEGSAPYRSSDQGKTWKQLAGVTCASLGMDPQNESNIYCLEMAGSVYVSGDEGESWQVAGPTVPDMQARLLSVSPNGSGLLLVGGLGFSISTDGGKSFQEHSSGIGAGRLDLRFGAVEPGQLLLEAGCAFRTSDNGRSWSPFGGSDGQSPCISNAVRSGDTLYWFDGQAWKSQDAGVTRAELRMPAPPRGVEFFAQPTIPGRLYALYSKPTPQSLFVSDDYGAAWHAAQGMRATADGKLYFAQAGQRMYAVGDLDAFRSDDKGENWRECRQLVGWTARSWSRLDIDPADPDHVMLATRGSGILTSHDGCMSWERKQLVSSYGFVNSIARSPVKPNTLFAGADNGAYVSFDGGDSWRQINDGLLGATVVYSVAVDPAGNVYAATPYGIFQLQEE